MIQKTEAIILKKQDLRETSLFLTLCTKGFGKICGVMKGIRGQRGQYSAVPQIFTLNEIVFYERKDREIFTVSQCELKEFFAQIRESLEKTSYAMYFIELTDSVTAMGEKNEQQFELLENSLNSLCGDASPRRIARIFEIKILDMLGMMPHLKNCVVCGSALTGKIKFSIKNSGVLCEACASKEKNGFPVSTGAVNFMEHIHRSDWAMASRIKVAQTVGRQVEQLLKGFLNYHLHLKPKSMEFIEKISA